MKHKKTAYKEHMQRLVEEYREAGQPWPATRKAMAKWMIVSGKWNRGESAAIDMCARDISRALREEYHLDKQGRRVRTKHAAKYPASGVDDKQQTLWGDMRTEPREFMQRAFKGRRNQIVGDCVQLNTDVKSFNENRSPNDPIPMLFDFRDDVLEAEQEGKLESSKPSAPLAPFPIPTPALAAAPAKLSTPNFLPSDVPVRPRAAVRH